ncbi:MAG: hypothetical protein GX945_11325 [Lentisphaerae bacterium]|nr:hypothetical protein [Lentisphaerota bacterium]
MNPINFKRFKNGTLFLIRKPESFPVGYAQSAFEDMKRLHLDYAAWLETWNCRDGVPWIHPDYPRSSFWKDCPRDPLEETFAAADKTGIAFLPECGVMHVSFVESHSDAMLHSYEGKRHAYGRIGLVPSAPVTADFFIAKYDAFIDKFKHHPSFRGICLPAENNTCLSYDRYTEKAWREFSGRALPTPKELAESDALERETYRFMEDEFLRLFRKLAQHIKQKYGLSLMHYPISTISTVSHFEPNSCTAARNLEVITKVEEIDLFNLQLHPPLGDHPGQFKMEIELLEALTDKPCVADTHWYHECNAGKLPELNPKRYIDWILSTLTPHGVSFFCYGFMAEKLPLWKVELNPGARVFNCYANDDAVAIRRKAVLRGMDFVETLRPLMENMEREAQNAVFYRESLEDDYRYGSYYREHLFSLYGQLQATARPLIFTAEIPETTENIRCLIFDAVKTFSADDARKLEKFLAAGGQVVVIGRCSPALYAACGLNVRECEADFVARPGTPGRWWFGMPRDAIKFTANGDTLYAYNTGEAAVTRQNGVFFIGCSAAVSDFDNLRQRGLVDMWLNMIELCQADSGVKVRADFIRRPGAHEYVCSDLYTSTDGKRKLLLIRDLGVEVISSEVKWDLPDNFRITRLILDGRDIAMPEDGILPEFEYFAAVYAEAF